VRKFDVGSCGPLLVACEGRGVSAALEIIGRGVSAALVIIGRGVSAAGCRFGFSLLVSVRLRWVYSINRLRRVY
jgi:hypothetical protein